MGESPTKGPSRAALWILVLAGSGLALALIVMFVVGRDRADETDQSRRGKGAMGRAPSGPGSAGEGHRVRRRAVADGRRWSRRGATAAERRRLAELLGRDRDGPRARGGPGGGSAPGGRPGGGAEEGAADDDPVFPISAKGIRGAIRARIAEIKECYDGWLAADDTLGGKLTVAFTIEADPDGDLARIGRAEIQGSTLDHPGLERCVLVMAESLRFEAPEKGAVTVRYPFRFSPGK